MNDSKYHISILDKQLKNGVYLDRCCYVTEDTERIIPNIIYLYPNEQFDFVFSTDITNEDQPDGYYFIGVLDCDYYWVFVNNCEYTFSNPYIELIDDCCE